MEPPLRKGIFNAVLLVLLSFFLAFPAGTVAQDQTSGGGNQPHDFQRVREILNSQTEQTSSTLNPIQSGVNTSSLDGKYKIFEHDQMWNRNSNPNPNWNFPLFEQGEPAGNINGDSLSGNPLNDFIVTGQTGTLNASTWKTAVFFGGNTSGEPEQIIPRELVPVGDLNGDGHADAVAVDNPDTKPVEIYEGSDTGYIGTGKTLVNLDPSSYEISGFVDFNQDSLKDIFAYSESSGEILIAEGVEGENSFSDITASVYYEVLSFSSKKVIAKDIDQDDLVEIVEFKGGNGDGQIQVLEFNYIEQVFSQDVFSFGFNPPFDNASKTDLHLIDVNGDDYDDIYISLGRKSPKYVLEYDDEAEVPFSYVEASNVKIWNGELVPAGDLDNDKKHDFIIGDPDNNFAPYIAYGDSNFSSNISLDNPLKGDTGSDWSWEMQYNLYSGFWDLDGDGIDDVLISHTEASDEDVAIGRRILPGNASRSHTSEFQLYPYEHFYNTTFEVEELGDVNEDGVDDFAIILAYQGKIEIYYGGKNISQSPDQTINSGLYISSVTSGHFSGDDIQDLAVLSWTWNSPQIEVFEGGTSFNRIKSVAVSDFQNAEINSASSIDNIGDTNGNGSADFLVGSGTARDTTGGNNAYLNEAYIFHGGSSVALSQDPPLDMDTENDTTSISAAASATALGDLDGDGLGDFAVGSPMKGNGEVSVYLSNSESPKLLATSDSTFFFGWDVASGDFNNDGIKDLAASVATSTLDPPQIIQIYYGEKGFDSTVDLSLALPDFDSAENQDVSGLYNNLEVVPDFNNDGKDELVIGSSGIQNNHAALYTFNGSDHQVSFIKGVNSRAGLGGNNLLGPGEIAAGDFTGSGEIDLVISQFNDNSDGYQSSRVYRYALTLPIKITSVADVPDDQGGKVRIDVGGYLMDMTSGFDSLSVQRKTEGSWKTLVTDEGNNYYKVEVPQTQPADVDEDYSYTFRVTAHRDTVENYSQEVSGRAFDNIEPPQVQDVILDQQNDSLLLSWQKTNAPDLDTYLIYHLDENGQLPNASMDSTGNTSFTLPDTLEGVHNFVVRARDIHYNIGVPSLPVSAIYPKTLAYDLNTGWNLTSFAVDDDSAKSALQELANGPLYKYDGGYQEVEQVEEGGAYWMKFADAANPEFRGLPLTELSLELKEGWNLIGSIGGELPVSFIDDSLDIIIPETIYSFDNAYISADTLRPTKGYWIRTSSAGKVTLTHPKFLEQQNQKLNKYENSLAKSAGEITDLFNKITIFDDEHSAELYFGSKLPNGADKRMFSLPPLPPGDVFDARFEGDMRLTENDKVDIRLNTIAGKSLKVKIQAGSTSEANLFVIKEFTDGKLQAKHTVTDSEEITLKHKETDSITLTPVGISEVGRQEAPGEFDLEQNYPNPFNPTTQIRYSVAEATNVKIDVYNILGRRIMTLVNERQDAGTYEVTFDGSNFASGIYLYRLQAGDYISTKKFILAK